MPRVHEGALLICALQYCQKLIPTQAFVLPIGLPCFKPIDGGGEEVRTLCRDLKCLLQCKATFNEPSLQISLFVDQGKGGCKVSAPMEDVITNGPSASVEDLLNGYDALLDG